MGATNAGDTDVGDASEHRALMGMPSHKAFQKRFNAGGRGLPARDNGVTIPGYAAPAGSVGVVNAKKLEPQGLSPAIQLDQLCSREDPEEELSNCLELNNVDLSEADKLKYDRVELIVDSGAGAPVANPDHFPGCVVTDSPGSLSGQIHLAKREEA